MSASAEVLQSTELMGSRAEETALPNAGVPCEAHGWNPEDFADEQMRGLVRRVFFPSGAATVKQVAFCAADPRIDVADICNRVGRALALETCGDIAVVGCKYKVQTMMGIQPRHAKKTIKSWSTQAAINLWNVPEFGLNEYGEESGTARRWLSRLERLRNEFEYSIIHGPVAGASSEAALLGQLADGIVLVLGAHSTRRATARKIKETLETAHSRILGSVLSGRTFPVPEQIYRRL
jgi:hypothetical protein